jgi:hypothetical protein
MTRIPAGERKELRDLAKRVKDIALHPVWKEKIRLWEEKNGLRKCRPLVLCSLPEAAWDEIIPQASLTVSDPFIRTYESGLRRSLYRWEQIKDDEIVTSKIRVPIVHSLTDWIEGRKRPYSERADRAAAFHPSLHSYRAVKKLTFPILSVDRQQTKRNLSRVHDIFGGILEIEEGEPFFSGSDGEVMGWGNGLIDLLCELRGLENVFYDLYSAPQFIHEMMEFLMRGTLHYFDQLEKEDLLRLNNNEFVSASNTPLGSNGLACTDELPGKDFDPRHVRTRDLWGFTQAQEFSEVSPEHHAEFVLPYQQKVAERFGLNSYGCCEPNDRKWDQITSRIPRLREVSVSHAADLRVAAEKLNDQYVLSWKPHPVTMIAEHDEHAIRDVLRKGLRTMRDCHVIVCLRDTQTLFGEPERAGGWTRVALEVAAEFEQ